MKHRFTRPKNSRNFLFLLDFTAGISQERSVHNVSGVEAGRRHLDGAGRPSVPPSVPPRARRAPDRARQDGDEPRVAVVPPWRVGGGGERRRRPIAGRWRAPGRRGPERRSGTPPLRPGGRGKGRAVQRSAAPRRREEARRLAAAASGPSPPSLPLSAKIPAATEERDGGERRRRKRGAAGRRPRRLRHGGGGRSAVRAERRKLPGGRDPEGPPSGKGSCRGGRRDDGGTPTRNDADAKEGSAARWQPPQIGAGPTGATMPTACHNLRLSTIDFSFFSFELTGWRWWVERARSV